MPEKKQIKPKRPVPVGTDTACMISRCGISIKLPISYWDLWFAIVAVDHYGEDLEGLAEHFREKRAGFSGSTGRESANGKLSHLRDLQQRLREVGASVSDVIETAGPELVKQERRRSTGRVLKHNERRYERSFPMQRLPHERLYPAVLREHWPQFPISPEPYAERLGKRFNWDKFYGENASHGLARKFDSEAARAEKLLAKFALAEALAMLRSLMTVAVELTAIADDSFGAIGDSFQEAFELYLQLPWRASGIESEVFLCDLTDFILWEDYGFTYEQTDGFFASLTDQEADICLGHLRKRRAEFISLDLDYQAEETLTLRGQIIAEQERFELFEDSAREMAAHAWRRIILLADTAHKAGNTSLAKAVFEAALTQGTHLDFLKTKYEQLLAGDWNPDPRYKGRSAIKST